MSKFLNGILVSGSVELDNISTDTSTSSGLFINSSNLVVKRSLGTMAFQDTGAYYTQTASDSRYLQTVILSVPSILSVDKAATPSGTTITLNLANQAANTVFSGPSSGGNATPSFRSLVAADVPFVATNYVPYTGASSDVNLSSHKLTAGSLVATASGTTPITLSNAIADLESTANSYIQCQVRNASSGVNASSDYVATADTGTDSTNYINFGINSSAYSQSSWTINGALDGYLYTSNSNLSIGTASSNYLNFFVGGTYLSNEALRINSSKHVLVGSQYDTNTSSSLFQVNGLGEFGTVSITGDSSTAVEQKLTIGSNNRFKATFTLSTSGAVSGDIVTLSVVISGVTTNLGTFTIPSNGYSINSVATGLANSINTNYPNPGDYQSYSSSSSVIIILPVGITSSSGYSTSSSCSGSASIVIGNGSFSNGSSSSKIYIGIGNGGQITGGTPFIMFGTAFSSTSQIISSSGLTNWTTLKIAGSGTTAANIIGQTLTTTSNTSLQFSLFNSSGSTFSPTSGSSIALLLSSNASTTAFIPSSGTATYEVLKITSAVYQSGGTGYTSAIHISPSLSRSETLATCTFTVTAVAGGTVQVFTNNGAINLGNGNISVSGTTTNAATQIAAAITAATGSNGGYTATSSTNVVTVSGPTGSGSTINGYVSTTTGSGATITSTNFSNGVTAGSAYDWRSIYDDSNLGFSYYQSGSSAKNYFAGKVLIGSSTDNSNGQLQLTGNLSLNAVGNKILIKSGSNCSVGTGTLSSGSVTISNTLVTSTCTIHITANGSSAGMIYEDKTSRSSGTSFTVKSTSGSDNTTFCYLIVEQI